MGKKREDDCAQNCDATVKKANMEAYNSYGKLGEKEKYSRITEEYNSSIVYRLIQEEIGVRNKIVCELGCGNAAHLKWYKRDCKQFVGLDISKSMLRSAMKEIGNGENVNFVIADALTLPFRNDSFDSVTIYQSAHHFPNIYKCMDEMLRVANAFAFFEPNKASLLHKIFELVRERRMRDCRFDLHNYKEVEYNSRGFAATEIKHHLAKRSARSSVHYIFTLPMETSGKIMRKSQALFVFLSLFGYALTRIPIIKPQFGNLVVIARRK